MAIEAFHDEENDVSILPEVGSTERQRWWRSTKAKVLLGLGVVLLLCIGFLGGTDKGRDSLKTVRSKALKVVDDTGFVFSKPQDVPARPAQERQPLTHLLVPASNPSPDLCKLLLTTSTLRYPQPHLLAWNTTFEKPFMLGGGSHIAKIRRTLEYLERLPERSDDELVLMVDAYDVWFQVPPEVLVERYYDILEQTDLRTQQRFGPKAMSQAHNVGEHAVSSRIVFAAGKRCAPNQVHTIACYAIPESPLPEDLYGGNTDSPVGINQYYSYRQGYLNSGYIMGPVGEMRRIFHRAAEEANGKEELWLREDQPLGDPMDNGSGGSDYMYHGSDQSIFSKIFGRQEYLREVLRRRWDPSTASDEWSSRIIEGTHIPDMLNPPFSHERWESDKLWVQNGKALEPKEPLDLWKAQPLDLLEQYDFGITLDYFSDLGHQTVNSERDAAWLIHGQPALESQLETVSRTVFDCPLHLPSISNNSFPHDLRKASHPALAAGNVSEPRHSDSASSWLTTPLYTHLCLSNPSFARIPAMIHHNGDKSRRWKDWHHMSWLYDASRPLLTQVGSVQGTPTDHGSEGSDRHNSRDDVGGVEQRLGIGGAWTHERVFMPWAQLCPMKMLLDGGMYGSDDGALKSLGEQK